MGLQKQLQKLRAGINLSAGSQLLTLSLDGPSISVVSFKGKKVESWFAMPVNPRLVSSGGVQDPQALADALKVAVGRVGGRGKLLAAYPSARLSARTLSLPPVKGVKPNTLIPREARRIMGTAADYHHLFWVPLETFNGGSTYYLLAVPRNEMNNYMQSLSRGGLKPKRIESRALALTRAVGASEAIIANLRTEGAEVLVVTRSLPLVTTQRSLELQISPEDLVSEMVEVMQQAITFYGERNLGPPLPNTTPIYLSGKHHLIGTPLINSLQGTLRRPVELPEPAIDHPTDFPTSEFMVNIGLALGEA